MTQRVTRLAPSPTGALHIGNARTFVINWLLARQQGWKIIYRNEDLDGPRTKTGAAEQAVEDLKWLGLDWDERSCDQSQRSKVYEKYLKILSEKQLAYPCTCSRKDIEQAASAPHAEDMPVKYPGTCLKNPPKDISRAAWRLKTNDKPIVFTDRFAGRQSFSLDEHGGDFVIFRSNQLAAYQLAVVIDDHESGVTDIVRGADLLDSAARQLYLQKILDFPLMANYCHLPLVTGSDGRRLAKRHGDTRLSFYRENGCTPEKMLGLLAHLCNIIEKPCKISLKEFLSEFKLEKLDHNETVFTSSDNAYLLNN